MMSAPHARIRTGCLAGIPVIFVDPRNTSRTCAECGHCERANRRSQGEFSCQACGHTDHADASAARNIRARAMSKLAPGLGARLAG
jgi:putative transposase